MIALKPQYYLADNMSDNLKLSMSKRAVKMQGFHPSPRPTIVNKSVYCEIKLRAWYVSAAAELNTATGYDWGGRTKRMKKKNLI